MISVTGIGWIDGKEYGSIFKNMRASYKEGAFPKDKIFPFSYKHIGRLDNVSRLTCAAVALALKDAGIECAPGHKHDAGIISTNSSGSIETDMLYFRDYLESGRTLSRGNLFIYTLPSSPSGEAAIYFGLQGPLLYITGGSCHTCDALKTAAGMVLDNEASVMLAGTAEEGRAIYFVLKAEDAGASLCGHDDAVKVLNKGLDFRGTVDEFENFRKGATVK
ncbi:MAG: beta-ketoacyl synthase N-terminal-like domain-containing protein [Nitrospirota bacterium]